MNTPEDHSQPNPDWVSPPGSPPSFRCFQSKFEELVRKYALAQNKAIEALTEKQLADAIRQAIEAGDFMRSIKFDHETGTNSQRVVYLPGYGMDQLRTQICELKALLREHKIEPPA